jgi:hypothetical protein
MKTVKVIKLDSTQLVRNLTPNCEGQTLKRTKLLFSTPAVTQKNKQIVEFRATMGCLKNASKPYVEKGKIYFYFKQPVPQ